MDHPGRPEAERDASLVEAVRAGRPDAFQHLVEAYFDRCWEVSWRILHDRERAAEVAQDVMLTAWQKLDTLDAPGSFGGWVLRMSRNRSLDRLAHERRALPTDEPSLLEPPEPVVTAGDPEREAVRREAHDLVWDAAAALGERDASILDLHLRHGLEARELAVELGIAPNAANQALHRMRGRLGTAIRARMLWHGGRPSCAALGEELAAARLTRFGPDVARLVDRHAARCEDCGRRQRALVGTDAMFAGVPLVAVPLVLRAASARALAEQGVPVPTSWTAGPAPSAEAGPSAGGPGTPAGPGAAAPASTSGGVSAAGTGGSATAFRGPTRTTVTTLVVLLTLALLAGGVAVVGGLLDPTPAAQDEASPDVTVVAPTTRPRAPTPSTTVPGEVVSPVPLPTPTLVGPPLVPTLPPSLPPSLPPTTGPAGPAPTVAVDAVWIGSGSCPTENRFLYRVRWSTADADTAVLSGSGGTEPVALAGEVERCAGETARFTLTATGPGGETAATDEARATPAG